MTSSVRSDVLEEDLRGLAAAPLRWEALSGKTVLVTGATGLIGSYLVELLLYLNEVSLKAPCRVVALARDAARAAKRFERYGHRSDLEFLVQDVAEAVPAGLKTDYVIHAAGNATPKRFGKDPVGTYSAAVLGTHRLLEHAQRAGCEGFLLLSSGVVHGAVAGEHTVIDERVIGVVDPLDAYACYAESKRMAETMCACWARQFGLPTRMARLGHTYGPGLRRDDDRAFAQFVFSVIDRQDIVLHSDGAAERPYCYLSDAADALFRILLNGADGAAYLVVNTDAKSSVLELATMLAGLEPERGVRVTRAATVESGAVPNKDPARRVDTSLLRGLGWSPSVGIEEGFRRTLRSQL